MPTVTVPARPSGEPIAITPSPTARSDERPIGATVGFATGTLTTARSVFGSRADDLGGDRGSRRENTASIVPRDWPVAGATTWSLVRT